MSTSATPDDTHGAQYRYSKNDNSDQRDTVVRMHWDEQRREENSQHNRNERHGDDHEYVVWESSGHN